VDEIGIECGCCDLQGADSIELVEIKTCGEQREGARVDPGGEGKEDIDETKDTDVGGDGGERGLLIGVCSVLGGDNRLLLEGKSREFCGEFGFVALRLRIVRFAGAATKFAEPRQTLDIENDEVTEEDETFVLLTLRSRRSLDAIGLGEFKEEEEREGEGELERGFFLF